MAEYRYLLVLAACLVAVLPLEWLLQARVVRRPRRWVACLVPPVVVFVAVDALLIAAGQRQLDERYLTGLTLRGVVPVEELLLLLVVPTGALLVHEGVGSFLHRRHEARTPSAGGGGRRQPVGRRRA